MLWVVDFEILSQMRSYFSVYWDPTQNIMSTLLFLQCMGVIVKLCIVLSLLLQENYDPRIMIPVLVMWPLDEQSCLLLHRTSLKSPWLKWFDLLPGHLPLPLQFISALWIWWTYVVAALLSYGVRSSVLPCWLILSLELFVLQTAW